jgi:DNA-directed RNA polymerase subunit M/transcription elongation factor TFIIS
MFSIKLPTSIVNPINKTDVVHSIIPEINILNKYPVIKQYMIEDNVPDLINLVKTGNIQVILDMIADGVSPDEFVYKIPAQQSNVDLFETEILSMQYEPEVEEDSIYTCSKCHGKKFTKIIKQTRSGDEGYTYFYTCCNKNCKTRFRITT